MYKIDLDDGKYTIIENLEKGKFEALRYSEEWRNLIGDNLILSLVNKIQELEQENSKLKINNSLILEDGVFSNKHGDNYAIINGEIIQTTHGM